MDRLGFFNINSMTNNTKNIVKYLPKQFTGTGEVSGFEFNQVYKSQNYYIYEVTVKEEEDTVAHFEVIKRLNTPVCIDFDKRLYSDTDVREVYPKSRMFGSVAWSFSKKDDAINFIIDRQKHLKLPVQIEIK